MSDIVNKNENLELELDDNTILSNLFGINDRNLSLIELSLIHISEPTRPY